MVAVGRGLCADSLSGESSLAMLRGLDGDSGVMFFRAALLFFSAPLGCSPLRSLSQSPRPPEDGPAAREAGPNARAGSRGGAEALASLAVRWGDTEFPGAGRKRSLCSLSAGVAWRFAVEQKRLLRSLSAWGALRSEGRRRGLCALSAGE